MLKRAEDEKAKYASMSSGASGAGTVVAPGGSSMAAGAPASKGGAAAPQLAGAAGGSAVAGASVSQAGAPASSAAPVSVGTVGALSASAAMASIRRPPDIPNSVPQKLPDVPTAQVQPPPLGDSQGRNAPQMPRIPVTQNVPDRTIAHVVTGGIGSH